MNEDSRPDPSHIGLADMLSDGWFNGKTGDLLPGVRVRSSHTVIAVGRGDDGLVGFCAGQSAQVIFIDNDSARLAVTEARIRQSPARAYRAILSGCDPVPLEDGIGDLVICAEVLEHVPDPLGLLREMVRVARPGARLLITVPDARSEQFVAATAPSGYFREPNHIRVFSAEDLRRLVLDAGLDIECQQSLGCFWSMYLPLSWLTAAPGPGVPVDNPHPITDHWTRLWEGVQAHPRGDRLRRALNEVLPRTLAIVAARPG